jgi:prepilin-type N-terminal cleavage/methylation domain-containing protein
MLRSKGLTLTEILVAMLILGVLTLPLYKLFTTSQKMNASSRDLVRAMGFASSYISALKAVDRSDFRPLGPVRDLDLHGALSLEALGLEPCLDGFSRHLTLRELSDSQAALHFFQILVDIRWKGRVSGNEMNYPLKTLVPRD